MPVPGIAITARFRRGSEGISPFALAWEEDLYLNHITVANEAERLAVPEWKRRPKMIVRQIDNETEYILGAVTTIAGQVWTVRTYGVPNNVVTEDEIFDEDGYVQPGLIRNIFLNESFVVDSEAAMLALTTVTGNFVVRTDTDPSSIYVKLNNDSPSALNDFAELTVPAGVVSVNGQTGAVTITLAALIAANPTVFNDAVEDTVAYQQLLGGFTTLYNLVLTSLNTFDTQLSTTILAKNVSDFMAVQDGFLYFHKTTENSGVWKFATLGSNLTLTENEFGGVINAPGGGGGGGAVNLPEFSGGVKLVEDVVSLGGELIEDVVIPGNRNAFVLGGFDDAALVQFTVEGNFYKLYSTDGPAQDGASAQVRFEVGGTSSSMNFVAVSDGEEDSNAIATFQGFAGISIGGTSVTGSSLVQLSSTTKALTLTTTAALSAIISPQLGMLTYSEEYADVVAYIGANWIGLTRPKIIITDEVEYILTEADRGAVIIMTANANREVHLPATGLSPGFNAYFHRPEGTTGTIKLIPDGIATLDAFDDEIFAGGGSVFQSILGKYHASGSFGPLINLSTITAAIEAGVEEANDYTDAAVLASEQNMIALIIAL